MKLWKFSKTIWKKQPSLGYRRWSKLEFSSEYELHFCHFSSRMMEGILLLFILQKYIDPICATQTGSLACFTFSKTSKNTCSDFILGGFGKCA